MQTQEERLHDLTDLQMVRRARETLKENPVPFVGYIGGEDDIPDDVASYLQTLSGAISATDAYPKEAFDWLDKAEEALQAGEELPDPHLSWHMVDEEGHMYDMCPACGTRYRDDEDVNCGCPVGTVQVAPPPNDG